MRETRWRTALVVVAVLAAVLVAPATAGAVGEGVEPPIVGGTEINPPGKYPFLAALVASGTANAFNGQFCGASVIGDTWILTAAHCVFGESASGIDVVIGRHDLTTNQGDRIRAKAITMHPQYNNNTLRNDVAIIELVSATSASAVALPSDGSLETAGTSATVMGWGDTESTPRYPAKPREVNVPVLSDAQCTSAYGSEMINSVMLCAGDLPNGGEDSCQGDSGGPLVVPSGGGYTQVGIVSWGYGCADAGDPGVYSRVSALRSFIDDTTGSTGGGGGGGGTGSGYTCDGFDATLVGTPGADVLVGTIGPDVIVALGGDDDVHLRAGQFPLAESAWEDLLYRFFGTECLGTLER